MHMCTWARVQTCAHVWLQVIGVSSCIYGHAHGAAGNYITLSIISPAPRAWIDGRSKKFIQLTYIHGMGRPWGTGYINIYIIIHNCIMYVYGATCTCVFMVGGARKVYKVFYVRVLSRGNHPFCGPARG